MAEYSRIARGTFTSTGAAKFIALPFMPDYVEFTNKSVTATPAADRVISAKWWASDGQGTASCQIFNGGTTMTTDSVAVNGISTLASTSVFLTGPSKQVVAITKANPAQVTVTAHGYSVGDTVTFSGLYQSATTGMPQISDIYFTIVTIVDANNFTIKWNTNQSNYTALSGSPTGATCTKILFPFIYPPTLNNVSAITTGTTTTITCTSYHNFEVGQEIAFRIPEAWGTVELNSLPNLIVPGSPIYAYVTSITDNWTFVCNVDSSTYTAFNSNQPVASVPGMQIPQVIPVGDVNTGGNIITATSPLYPPPSFPTSSNRVPTINGPAIRGAFVNNSMQGFVIGAGTCVTDTSAVLVGANGNVINWRAILHDMSVS